MNDSVRKALLPQPRECFGRWNEWWRERYKRALDAKKSPGTFLKSGRRPGEEIRRNYVGTTYCAPNVKLTPAE
jgi:hypothetical protein